MEGTTETLDTKQIIDKLLPSPSVADMLSNATNSTVEREIACLMQIHSTQPQVSHKVFQIQLFFLLNFIFIFLFFVGSVLFSLNSFRDNEVYSNDSTAYYQD